MLTFQEVLVGKEEMWNILYILI